MADVNLKVFIKRPGGALATKLTFQSIADNDIVLLPRRLAYSDIVNLSALQASGYLRTGSTTVGKYSGGLELPRTEKLILLAQSPSTTAINLIITGNRRVGKGSTTVAIPEGTAKDIHEIDLYDLGFYIEDVANGGIKIEADGAVGLCLIARY